MPGDDRTLPRRFSGARPTRLLALSRNSRGPAQLQDPRYLHAALETRRQAPIPRPHPARLAIARSRPPASDPDPDRELARSPPAAQNPLAARSRKRGMIPPPRSAMVLAAGLGTRLRPVTETIPKPLVEIDGRPLIDHAIDRLASAGVEHVVVNIHYKAAMIAEHLARRGHPRIKLSHEAELLDTGGGVARALPSLGEAFFAVNSDVFWLDNEPPALLRLAAAFDPDTMDAVLLLHPTATAVGYDGNGDYFLEV